MSCFLDGNEVLRQGAIAFVFIDVALYAEIAIFARPFVTIAVDTGRIHGTKGFIAFVRTETVPLLRGSECDMQHVEAILLRRCLLSAPAAIQIEPLQNLLPALDKLSLRPIVLDPLDGGFLHACDNSVIPDNQNGTILHNVAARPFHRFRPPAYIHLHTAKTRHRIRIPSAGIANRYKQMLLKTFATLRTTAFPQNMKPFHGLLGRIAHLLVRLLLNAPARFRLGKHLQIRLELVRIVVQQRLRKGRRSLRQCGRNLCLLKGK